MEKTITQRVKFVGLDVHKDSIDVAVAESDGSAVRHIVGNSRILEMNKRRAGRPSVRASAIGCSRGHGRSRDPEQ